MLGRTPSSAVTSHLGDGPELDEKLGSPTDEKQVDAQVSIEENFTDADEALELVGMRRTEHFSEEYNRKLRRKLVSHVGSRMSFLFSKRSQSYRILRSLLYVLQSILLSFCK